MPSNSSQPPGGRDPFSSLLPSGTPENNGYFLRSMRSSDLDIVVRNESLAYQHPWSKRIFVDCLRAGYQCWVLANRNEIVAHGVMSVAIGECHLLTLCVHPEHQRNGYGIKLFKALLDRAAKLEAEVCFLEVRSSNESAKALYRSLGFVQIGERKNYYPMSASSTGSRAITKDDREDAIIMSRELPLP